MQHPTPAPAVAAPITPPRARIAFAAALVAAALAHPAAAQQQPARPACTTPAIQAAAGAVCGAVDTTVVAGQPVTVPVYRGIPYAQAPTGAAQLRWKAPQPLAAADSTIRATAFGLICMQTLLPDTTSRSPVTVVDTLATGESEDCLYLNVWTPPGATAGSRLPVMVFIHGGAFVIGHGSSPMYNGAYLAAADTVILVTLNYRLGALGFLYSTASSNGVNGNLGLLDQQMALQWVRRNISAFGGDTSQVTLFGESAGAMSTGFHLFQMPSSDSLFHAAIMESNPMGVVYRNTTQAQGDGDGYIEKLCRAAGGGLQCDVAITARGWFNRNAQSVTPLQVLQAQATFDGITPAVERIIKGGLPQGLPWTPTVDGQVVMGQPLQGYAPGMTPKPYVFGFNRDEGVVFAALGAGKLDTTAYNAVVERVFFPDAGTVRNFAAQGSQVEPYNARSDTAIAGMPLPASALAGLITDMAFKCANLAAADTVQADTAQPPVFGYLFQRSPIPFTMYTNVEECSADSGMVCHANELPYVFNTLAWADTFYVSAGLQAADTSLARQMATAWANFAKRPTQPPVSGWTPYTTSGAVYSWSGISNGPMVTDVASTANCTDLWVNVKPLRNGSTSTTAAGPASTAPPGTGR